MKTLLLHPLRYSRHMIVAILLVALTATSAPAQYPCAMSCVKMFGFIVFGLDGTTVFTSCFSLTEMDGSRTTYCIYT
jgi:hypothetical protein